MYQQEVKCDKPGYCSAGSESFDDAARLGWYEILADNPHGPTSIRILVIPFSGSKSIGDSVRIQHACPSHIDDVVHQLATDHYLAVEKLREEERKTTEALTKDVESV